ncbi:MAG: putative integral rane protein, partial [Mycobacterium sp.]|nr:putative integral rane protein [Mycobacterium sp.]
GRHVAAAGEADYGSGRTALGGGLLAAGLLALVTARRGPFGRGPRDSAVERRLRLAADPGKAEFLDTALRSLAHERARQGLPMPEAYVAFLRDDQLLVHFSPAPEGEPPAPWTAREDGRSWLVDADAVLPPPGDVLAPYPAMVNVGIAHGWEVLVDLEFAPGIVSLGGDPELGRDVAASAAVELATNLWSDDVDVTLVGFGDDLAAVAPDRIRREDRLADVLAVAEAESPRTDAVLRSLGVNGVLQGRAARPDRAALRPQVLVLSAPPAPEEAARLVALTGPGRSRFAVLCVGDTPAARWRFTVTRAGRLDLGVLGFDTEAHRLGVEDYRGVAELVRTADRTREDLAAHIRALTPGSALASLLDRSEDDDRDPPPVAPALPAELLDPARPAPVEIRLLGPVAVTAPSPVTPDRLPVLTEVVVAGALHPDGLHDAVLRASVWPRGVEDDVVDAAILDVQAWLGTGPDGTPRFSRGDDGRWRLGGDVRCDWHVLCGLVAGDEDAGERGRLYAALGLVRGEAFSAAPAGRYAWLAFHRAARDARLVGTAAARRLAVLALGRNDLRQAEWALRQGLALAPAAEVLWRDLLRLLGGNDPHAAERVADELYETLVRHGVPGGAEPETDALVQQLAPGRRVTTA